MAGLDLDEARAERIVPRSTSREIRLQQYFMGKGVGAEAASELAGLSGIYRHARGDRTVASGPFMEIVASGIVTDGRRLWGAEWWLGDLDVFREPMRGRLSRSRYEFVSPGRTIRIPREVMRSWAMRDLSVQRLLHQVLTDRFDILDGVYGLDHRTPLSRLAQLLLYLSFRSPDLVKLRLIPGRDDVLYGPTQRHLADALGVSLATVEKGMSQLRKNHILASSGKGRANRAYTIINLDLLTIVANGGTMPPLE
ncbi:Crp/Fnr family transcriptional regulator [Streptomyces lavendulocolor]|uniref:Crp/Fnr family transcriptional regulator n=1 Tax=Streptomyces lavendulocolor TaxID=67316 RepID=UPI003C2F526D